MLLQHVVPDLLDAFPQDPSVEAAARYVAGRSQHVAGRSQRAADLVGR
jgi:hypothetical protein